MDQTRLNFLFKFKNIKNTDNLFFYYSYENTDKLKLNKDFNQNTIDTNFIKINHLLFDCSINQYLNYDNLDLNKEKKNLLYFKKNQRKSNFKKQVFSKKLNLKEILSDNKSINLFYF